MGGGTGTSVFLHYLSIISVLLDAGDGMCFSISNGVLYI